jgi:hypothetical protein
MNLAKAFALLAAVTALAGCSAFDPFSTYPNPPGAGTHEKGPRVAICYDALVSSAAAVERAAQAECVANSVATRVDTDWLLQYCPLLLPARATFVCAPKTGK